MTKCKICGVEINHSEVKGVCQTCLIKPFSITSVCRVDLLMEKGMFKQKDVSKFSDAMMQDLADRIGETTCETRIFWKGLNYYGHELLEDL